MTEIVQYQPQTALTEQMDYAKAVANGSLLPREYQNNPANVLIAVGLGSSMGLSPAESLYRITVIQGKPTASAELIAANVRKAGHKLRVSVSENPPSATCTIIRADDPDHPTVITRDMEWAKGMGLVGKDNYKKQPSTMLSWRAISACARLACPEALYGVTYTPDELEVDRPAQTAQPAPATGADRMRSMLGQEKPVTDVHTEAEIAQATDSPYLNPQSALGKRMFATFNEAGITEKDDRLAYVSSVIGREVTTSKEMTDADAEAVIAKLREVVDSEVADGEIVEDDPTLSPEWKGGDQ